MTTETCDYNVWTRWPARPVLTLYKRRRVCFLAEPIQAL